MTSLKYILILGILLGLGSRAVFLKNVENHSSINILLPGTDEFNYDAMAKDLNSPEPLNLQMSVYPFYLHFVKWVYKIFGENPCNVYRIQLLLSFLSTALLFFIGSFLFGTSSGLIAAALHLFYRMNFFYDVLLLPTVLIQFLGIGCLFFFSWNRFKKAGFKYVCFCIFGIFLALLKAHFLLLLIPGACWMISQEKTSWKWKGYLPVTLVFIGVFVLLSNHLRSPEKFFHKIGILFYISHHEDATGLLMPLEGIPASIEGHAKDALKIAYFQSEKSFSGIERFWLLKGVDFIKKNPKHFFLILIKKLLYAMHPFEISNNSSIYLFENLAGLGGLPRITYSVLAILGIPGLFLAWNRKKAGFLIVSFGFVLISILFLFICSRYRMPLIPFWCLWGGYFIVENLKKTDDRKKIWKYWLLGGAFVITMAFVPVPFDKNNELLNWLDKEKKKVYFKVRRNSALNDFSKRSDLSHSACIDLLFNLADGYCYREFFILWNECFKKITDRANQIRLLKKKAWLQEKMFLFREAEQTWKELSLLFPEIVSLANYKMEELKIYIECYGMMKSSLVKM